MPRKRRTILGMKKRGRKTSKKKQNGSPAEPELSEIIDVGDFDFDIDDDNRLWLLLMWGTFVDFENPVTGTVRQIPEATWEPMEVADNSLELVLKYFENLVVFKNIPHPEITPEIIQAEEEGRRFGKEQLAVGQELHPIFGILPKQVIGYKLPSSDDEKFSYFVRWADDHIGLIPTDKCEQFLAEAVNVFLDLVYRGDITGMDDKLFGGCTAFRKSKKEYVKASRLYRKWHNHYITLNPEEEEEEVPSYGHCNCYEPEEHLINRLNKIQE